MSYMVLSSYVASHSELLVTNSSTNNLPLVMAES